MNKKVLLLAVSFSVTTLFSCSGQKGQKDISLKTDIDSVSYGIGISIGSNMKKDGLDSLDLNILKAAMHAAIKGDSLLMTQTQAQESIQTYLGKRQESKAGVNTEIGRKFLAENKKRPGVVELPSGLQYEVITEGTGPMPKEDDTVVTHYHGTLIDGSVFDSSVERGEPAEFPVGAVIKGWTEALQLMKTGSKWKLFIPSELAYGDRQAGPTILPNSTLIFEVELISIQAK